MALLELATRLSGRSRRVLAGRRSCAPQYPPSSEQGVDQYVGQQLRVLLGRDRRPRHQAEPLGTVQRPRSGRPRRRPSDRRAARRWRAGRPRADACSRPGAQRSRRVGRRTRARWRRLRAAARMSGTVCGSTRPIAAAYVRIFASAVGARRARAARSRVAPQAPAPAPRRAAMSWTREQQLRLASDHRVDGVQETPARWRPAWTDVARRTASAVNSSRAAARIASRRCAPLPPVAVNAS